MFVLGVIGAILGIYLLVEFVVLLNSLSYKKYGYEFFSRVSMIIVTIGYYFCYFGYQVFLDATKSDGDILNGILLMGIGFIFLLFMLIANIKNTNFIMGISFSVVQFLVYIPIAYIAFFVIVITIIALMNTKPVWVLNND